MEIENILKSLSQYLNWGYIAAFMLINYVLLNYLIPKALSILDNKPHFQQSLKVLIVTVVGVLVAYLFMEAGSFERSAIGKLSALMSFFFSTYLYNAVGKSFFKWFETRIKGALGIKQPEDTNN